MILTSLPLRTATTLAAAILAAPAAATTHQPGAPRVFAGELEVVAQHGAACRTEPVPPHRVPLRVALTQTADGRWRGVAWGTLIPMRLEGPRLDALRMSWIDLDAAQPTAGERAQGAAARLARQGDRLVGTWEEGRGPAGSTRCRWTLAKLDLRGDLARDARRDQALTTALGEIAEALTVLAGEPGRNGREHVRARDRIASATDRIVSAMPAKVHIESLLLALAERELAVGHQSGARRFAEQAAAMVRARLESEGVAVAGYVTSAAAMMRTLGDDRAAEALYREADRAITRRGETRHVGHAAILSGYGAVLLAGKQAKAAAEVFSRALKSEMALDADNGAGVRIAMVNLAAALDALGHSAEADRLRERAGSPSASGRRAFDT